MKKLVVAFVAILCLACKSEPKSDIKPETAIGTIAILNAAREIMTTNSCTFVSVNENGMPYARVMDPIGPDENFVVWLATSPRTRKVQQLETNPNVVLHYVDKSDNGYVSLYGSAELVRDSMQMKIHWKPEWDRFYRHKATDCILIKVQPTRIEIIDYRHGISGDPVTWQPTVITF